MTNKGGQRQGAQTADAVSDPYANMWARPGHLVRRLHQIHVGMFAEECSKFDITPIQFGFLTVLSEENALDQITLSSAVGIDRTSGADVIKRLMRRGLLTRVPSEKDKRAKLTQITEKGRKLVAEMYPCMVRSQQKFIAPLTPEERAAFNAILCKLIHANDSASRAPVRKDVWTNTGEQRLAWD